MKNEIHEPIERTNFDSSWADDCSFCGKKQKEHKKVHGPVNRVILSTSQALEETEKRMKKGKERFLDWESAKEAIRNA